MDSLRCWTSPEPDRSDRCSLVKLYRASCSAPRRRGAHNVRIVEYNTYTDRKKGPLFLFPGRSSVLTSLEYEYRDLRLCRIPAANITSSFAHASRRRTASHNSSPSLNSVRLSHVRIEVLTCIPYLTVCMCAVVTGSIPLPTRVKTPHKVGAVSQCNGIDPVTAERM